MHTAGFGGGHIPGPGSSPGPGLSEDSPAWSAVFTADYLGLVYCQALASDSGPRLSGNGGEGRGSTRGADSGLFLTRSHQLPVTEGVCVYVCVWRSRLPLLGCPEPKGLNRLQRSWHLGWEGQCGEGHQETMQSTND